MSKYYILDEETDPSKIGPDYPQCVGLLDGYDNSLENPRSLFSFAHKKGVRVSFEPDLNSIRIGSRTKLTDLISRALGPGNDNIISEKFKSILKQHSTGEIQYFNCRLHRKNQSFEYYWAHYIYSLELFVDYVKSEFSHSNDSLYHDVQNIKSYKDFIYFYENIDKY